MPDAVNLAPSLEAAFCDWEDCNSDAISLFYAPAGAAETEEHVYTLCRDEAGAVLSILVESKEEIPPLQGAAGLVLSDRKTGT